MIKHREIKLDEQKYAGIKTKVLFSEHDEVDFSSLHKQVIDKLADFVSSDVSFMAVDTDFDKESFSYMPMMPVNSFKNLLDYEKFTLEAGTYYAFEVMQKQCDPNWFKEVFQYINENGLEIDNKKYDLELFNNNYIARRMSAEYTNDDFKNEVFSVLFKKRYDK